MHLLAVNILAREFQHPIKSVGQDRFGVCVPTIPYTHHNYCFALLDSS